MEKKKMTRAEAFKYLNNKKVYVNNRSAQIQDILFKAGFSWIDGKNIKWLDMPFLFISADRISFSGDRLDFKYIQGFEDIIAEDILSIEIVENKMTTDELLMKLPSYIGRNMWIDKETGEFIGYVSDNKRGGDKGWFYLHKDGKYWSASYGTEGNFVCLNPDDENPPYNNAIFYGKTPNDALQGLYDWCVKNGFINE